MLTNTQDLTLIHLIKRLPCFSSFNSNNKISITKIEQGQSSLCFDVTYNQQRFFVKYIPQEVGVNFEITASQYAASLNLAPHIIFSNKHWLVCEFIEGVSLDNYTESISERIGISISLMKQCHTIMCELPIFDIYQTITALCKSNHFSFKQQTILQKIICGIEKVDIALINRDKVVFCHGDLNFSNVLIAEKPWLLDFECACSAEIEFDLAMFFAINKLTSSQQSIAIKKYNNDNNVRLNHNKLMNYLKAAYLLNGLWYLNRAKLINKVELDKTQFEMFEQLGLKQLSLFDEKFPEITKLAEVMR